MSQDHPTVGTKLHFTLAEAEEIATLGSAHGKLAPTWKIGDTVWYAPSYDGPWFRAVVATEPRLLGAHTWCVHLDDLSDAYRAYTGLPDRHRVAAASIEHIRAREPSDRRERVETL